MTRCVIVAGTQKHAQAILKWGKYDPDDWEYAAYGDKLLGYFHKACVVFPAEGLREEHIDWILHELVPKVRGDLESIPKTWPDVVPIPTAKPMILDPEKRHKAI